MAAPALSVTVLANLTQLREQLQKGLDPILATTRTHLRQMSNAFDGASIMSRATAAATAVGQLGGVAKLTSGEQQKLNGIVDQAIQKYQALGKQAPPEMLALRDATRENVSMFDRANDTLGKFGLSLRGLTLAGATAAFVGLSKQAIELAGHLSDVSAATGVNTTELQRLGSIGAQAGVSIDQIARGVQGLQRNLVSGNTGAVAAVRQLGLNINDLVGMDPGAMFEAIAQAVARIPDPAIRTNTAIELLGKQGTDLLPVLTQNIKDLETSTYAMSQSSVKRLDELGDTWTSFKGLIVAGVGEAVAKLSTLRGALEHLTPWAASVSIMADAAERGIEATQSGLPQIDAFRQHTDGLADAQARVNGYLKDFSSDRAKAAATAAKSAEDSARDHAAAVKAEADEIIRLNAALIDEITRMDAMVTHSFVTTQALEGFAASMKQMRQVLTLPEFGDKIAVAEHGLNVLMGKNSTAAALSNAVKFMPRVSLPKPPKISADDLGAGLGNALSLAIQGGGDVARAGGAFLGGELGKQLSGQFGDTLKNTLGKVVGGALNTVLPGIGTLLGSLAGKAIKGLGKLFGFGTAGRDLVQSFADSMGGFDALHAKLDQLGASGEQLWKTLTQGVGSNNPKQAQAAIDQVNAALDQFNQKQLDVQNHFATLLDAVDEFGGKAPKQLQPMIEQLLQMQGLTEEQRQLLTDMLGDPSMQAIQDAADTLGVTFDHLGANFKQAKIADTAFTYQHALDTLRDSGADMNGVLMDSKDKINALADQAIEAGASLPLTMKPYIEKLIEMGQLVAPDGSLVTNIDQLSFADIPDSSLDAIKTILQQIRDILKKDIPEAAGYAQSALDAVHMPADVSPGPTYAFVGGQWVNYGSAEAADNVRHAQNKNAASGQAGPIPMASGGFVHVERPTLFLAGEAGPEDAVFSGGGRSLGAGVNLSIVVNPSRGMNERELAQMVAERIPAVLRKAGY